MDQGGRLPGTVAKSALAGMAAAALALLPAPLLAQSAAPPLTDSSAAPAPQPVRDEAVEQRVGRGVVGLRR